LLAAAGDDAALGSCAEIAAVYNNIPRMKQERLLMIMS
jgi:hypothetical protein